MKTYKTEILVLLSFASVLLATVVVVGPVILANRALQNNALSEQEVQTARVVANGDILYHDLLYTSAQQEDGSYDFLPYFTYVKDWISDADLAIGDFEGTISPDYPLSGYPLFNAPEETATALQDIGYDVVDLAHNHILDSGLDGAIHTAQTFKDLGITPIGFYEHSRADEGIAIKEVNGIRIAILGYAYGFNGMEATLTEEEYERHLSDLDEEKIKAELAQAEQEADVTIVMPQMGEEYALEPNQDQVDLYHKMIDWGADVIFGGHPHVAQPSETIEKDGEKKFIIYSMGNFISNQSLETLDNIWTERGLLMDVTFEKTGDKTIVKEVLAHPTMVWSWDKGVYGEEGYLYRDYRVMILEDFIEGGRYRDELDDDMKDRVDTAYGEMNELVKLQW